MENKERANEKTMSKPLRLSLDENGCGKISFHSIGFEVRHYNELECEVLLLYTPNQVYHTASKSVREVVLKAMDLNHEATMFDLAVTPVAMNNGHAYFKAEVVPHGQAWFNVGEILAEMINDELVDLSGQGRDEYGR